MPVISRTFRVEKKKTTTTTTTINNSKKKVVVINKTVLAGDKILASSVFQEALFKTFLPDSGLQQKLK